MSEYVKVDKELFLSLIDMSENVLRFLVRVGKTEDSKLLKVILEKIKKENPQGIK